MFTGNWNRLCAAFFGSRRSSPRVRRRDLRIETLEDRRLLAGDQTTGLFVHNEAEAYEGVTLFNPQGVNTTYLINNDGDVINRWNSDYTPGLMQYLMPDGSLIRAGTPAAGPNPTFNALGGGGRLEWISWEGEVLWEFRYDKDNEYLAHHDIEVVWNNDPEDPFSVFMIAWDYKTQAEATRAGRNPELATEPTGAVYPDSIIQVKPILDAAPGNPTFEIVWQWHLWDHLVQDFDPDPDPGITGRNYYGPNGPEEHPELVDLNKISSGVGAGDIASSDWTHANGLSYNPDLDLLVISIRAFSEFWVIDHSTTTEEAAGHSGGNFGMGGDILLRWGNPDMYHAGDADSRTLWWQHDATWVLGDDPDPLETSDDTFLVFNNGWGRPDGNHSSVLEIDIPDVVFNEATARNEFLFDDPAFHGPAPDDVVWSYVAPAPRYFSPVISGAERLGNGNTLITFGTSGTFVEVNPAGETVWEYVNRWTGLGPLRQTEPLPSRGAGSPILDNAVFKIRRYDDDYFTFGGDFTYEDIHPDFHDTPGLAVPGTWRWLLNDSSGGSLDNFQDYTTPSAPSGWIALSGDWDGDGKDSVGLYNPKGNTWYLYGDRDETGTPEEATQEFTTAAPRSWRPVTGDWDGDGEDSVGLYDPRARRWHLNNRNTAAGGNDVTRFKTGAASASSIVFAGDWDGDGRDSVGLYDSSKRVWYLFGDRNPEGRAEEAKQSFKTPAPRAWKPIVGDWDGDGEDSVGLYDAAHSRWYLNNRNRAGEANDVLSYQTPGVPKNWRPIIGNWDGSEPDHPDLLVLDSSSSAGNAAALRVQIDINSTGASWFVDATPAADEERAQTSSLTDRRMKLLAAAQQQGQLLIYEHAQIGLISEARSVGVGGLGPDFPSALGKLQQDALDANAVDAIFSGA